MKFSEMLFLFFLVILVLGGLLILTGYVSMQSVSKYWFFYAPITEAILAVIIPFGIIMAIIWAYKNVGKGMM